MSDQISQRQPNEPAASGLDVPKGYGLSDQPGSLAWQKVSAWLAHARNYWIGTTRPDGRPHAAPVWGVWLDETLYFSTDRQSRKARNLAANPALVVHLESGDEVAILEGVAEAVSDQAILARFVDEYDQKYRFRPDVTSPGSLVYALRHRSVLAWSEREFLESAIRWRFA